MHMTGFSMKIEDSLNQGFKYILLSQTVDFFKLMKIRLCRDLTMRMNLPGFGFHELKGDRKGTYSVSVSGNWRLTYGFKDGDAIDVNLEDYH